MTDTIAGEVMVYEPITVLELAANGMRIEAPFPLHNDSLHEFRLALTVRSIVVRGRVARCEIGDLRDGAISYRCHIEFVEPAAHVAATLRDFVAVHDAAPPRIVDGEIAG